MDAWQLTDVANSTEPRRWRFGLRSLFTATVHVAVVLFLWQWLSFFCFFVLAGSFAALVVFRRNGKARCLVAMKSMTAYFLLSCAMLPFLDSLWLGELPVFTVLQVPKVDWAIWLLNVILRKVMWPIGLSITRSRPGRTYSHSLICCPSVSYARSFGAALGWQRHIAFGRAQLWSP